MIEMIDSGRQVYATMPKTGIGVARLVLACPGEFGTRWQAVGVMFKMGPIPAVGMGVRVVHHWVFQARDPGNKAEIRPFYRKCPKIGPAGAPDVQFGTTSASSDGVLD